MSASGIASFQRLAAAGSRPRPSNAICHEIDIACILPTISVPTLVLHREGDSIESVEAAATSPLGYQEPGS